MDTEQKTASGNSEIGGRTGLSPEDLRGAFLDHLVLTQASIPELASKYDVYMALAHMVRDRLVKRWVAGGQQYLGKGLGKAVAYLSAEFLVGPHLGNNLRNLGIYDRAAQALRELGLDMEEFISIEPEPGLGNGGLGRLAACFMDSLATLEIPAIGYGIRYEFGIFHQEIRDGWQVELTDKWLGRGNPWEVPQPEICYDVKLGGHTEYYRDETGRFQVRWMPHLVVKGVAYDTPIQGYGVSTCNTLRLWKAEAAESFDFGAFNVGDYYGAVDQKVISETISKVLYPNDEPFEGKQLRLAQQYFFVSCSIRDMIRMHLLRYESVSNFHETFAVQLNDTHPSIAVAELMRVLVDEHMVGWEEAWDITQRTFSYTNHTLMPEALEKWPVPLFFHLLPRHGEIILEINHRFLNEIRARFGDDVPRISRLSLIDETGERYVRMANLACVGSHAINGVAELHTELLKQDVLRDYYELFPEKFSNKTNGVTPRRFLMLSNPGLAELITEKIGPDWITRLEDLRKLEEFATDLQFQSRWRQIKYRNKVRLADYISSRTGVVVDPSSLFDIQVKRIHEYKRQHLNALHIITLYNRIKKDPRAEVTPRTFVFGGKAAPGYLMAKLIIKLINSVAEVVNTDPDVKDRLKVVFVPDFSVKVSQQVYPAADVSEQISTAGKEASGTGNMKFSLNGALTVGTLDGANIEIREEVGPENFFLFGLTAGDVYELKARGYRPMDYYESAPSLREVIDTISSGLFSRGDAGLFKPLVDSMLWHDDYLLLADYQSYIDCQDSVGRAFNDEVDWTRMSILNVARMGKFSSDRAIRQYATDIWKAKPVPVKLQDLRPDRLDPKHSFGRWR